MKRIFLITCALLLASVVAPVALAQKAPDVQNHPTCKYCGMDREQFAHSRVFIEYEDGSSLAACSIHCAAVDLALHIDKTPKSIQVGDFDSKKLIDAEQATWVIGGNKPGVMTRRAKWAFEKKLDAEQFVKENGGQIATFDQVMQATYEDMYADTKMIREKRKMKRTSSKQHPSSLQENQPQPAYQPKSCCNSQYKPQDQANTALQQVYRPKPCCKWAALSGQR
jgi:nitrous oxide reductase accessory protein NosL